MTRINPNILCRRGGSESTILVGKLELLCGRVRARLCCQIPQISRTQSGSRIRPAVIRSRLAGKVEGNCGRFVWSREEGVPESRIGHLAKFPCYGRSSGVVVPSHPSPTLVLTGGSSPVHPPLCRLHMVPRCQWRPACKWSD